MQKRYKKRPDEKIYLPSEYKEYGKLVKGMCNSISCYQAGNNEPHVHTIHDGQICKLEVGDFIMPEPDGEHFYPIKPDIFHNTYYCIDEPELPLEGSVQTQEGGKATF